MDLIHSPAFAISVNELLHQTHTPGIAVAIVQNDTIASKGFGWATLDPPLNVTADTLFDIASSSKSLTAASVALFVVDDENHPFFQWDTPMSFLIPEDFAMSGDGYTDQVTVEDILSHRSGFPRHDFSHMSYRAEHPDTPQSITRNLRNLENAAPLRQTFIYSNIMYIVASWLVEKMSGISFASFLLKEFFEPLGMTSTYLQPSAVIEAGLEDRIATPYVWDEESHSFRIVSLIEAPEAQGCGSIFTSVTDYIKWVRAIMNKEKPISNELYNGLLKPRIKSNPEDDDNPDIPVTWYAAGFEIQGTGGYKIVIHNGAVSGFQSLHFFMPELKFGAVLFANKDGWNATVSVATLLVREAAKSVEASRIIRRLETKQKQDVTSIRKRRTNDLQQRLCPGHGDSQNEDMVLSAYTGRYCNKGYHCLNVEVQANALFVNATDRSNAFTLTFEYACDERIFLARFVDYYDGDYDEIPAAFELSEETAVRLGIEFEPDLEKPIWFDRVVDDSPLQQNEKIL